MDETVRENHETYDGTECSKTLIVKISPRTICTSFHIVTGCQWCRPPGLEQAAHFLAFCRQFGVF